MSVPVFASDIIMRSMGLEAAHLEGIRQGFRALSAGEVVQPPVMRIDVAEHDGEVDVKGAYVRGQDSFAVKLSSGFFRNPDLGLPSGSGLMILLDAVTGRPRAVLLDDGYLTELRTALAGAVAADALAGDEVDTVGILGAGSQAGWQARALLLVRSPKRFLVWSRDPAKAQRKAMELAQELGLAVEASDDVEAVVRASDVVITTTPSRAALVSAAWLHPGLHITAMGSDAETKQELEPAVMARADVVVSDRRSQGLAIGELRAAAAAGIDVSEERVAELGEVLSGARAGRTSADQVTVCDLTGTGVQDTVIARATYARLSDGGAGRS